MANAHDGEKGRHHKILEEALFGAMLWAWWASSECCKYELDSSGHGAGGHGPASRSLVEASRIRDPPIHPPTDPAFPTQSKTKETVGFFCLGMIPPAAHSSRQAEFVILLHTHREASGRPVRATHVLGPNARATLRREQNAHATRLRGQNAPLNIKSACQSPHP